MSTTLYRELLLGCGHSREKRIVPNNRREWSEPYTLDIDRGCAPDFVCDLSRLIYGHFDLDLHCDIGRYIDDIISRDDLNPAICRFHDNIFDEVHAYEVLEHCGAQGDYNLFFAQFRELWRILKPGGYLCATVPDYRSIWAFGDPGHTRVISAASLVFLSQRQYKNQLGKTAMSDYLSLLSPADFEILNCRTEGEQMRFVLQAIK